MSNESVILSSGIAAVASLLVPGQALADIALPLAFVTVPLLPIIIMLEVLVFRIAAARLFNIELRFWNVVNVVILSNVITSLLGIPLSFYDNRLVNVFAVGIAFVLSVLIEWGIYIPFFRKDHVGPSRLLLISLLANVISYALLIPLIPGILYPY